MMLCIFLFKQKTAYEMRISDWSSDVCSSDLSWSRSSSAPSSGIAARSIGQSRTSCAMPSWSRSSSAPSRDRKSVVSGKSVYVRVDLGGRRIINNKNYKIHTHQNARPHREAYKRNITRDSQTKYTDNEK